MMKQFTIKAVSWTPRVQTILDSNNRRDSVLQTGTQSTADPNVMAAMSDSFMVVGHGAQRATYFDLVEHCYLTDHANGMTKLNTSLFCVAGY